MVDAEFADAHNRTGDIKDHYGYSLSETGVFLVSAEINEHSAVVTLHPFASRAGNADWTQFIPTDEDVAVIELDQRFVAAATTPHNVVPVFSLSCIQTATYGVQVMSCLLVTWETLWQLCSMHLVF